MNYFLRCLNCGSTYSPDENIYTCPKCGPRLGTLETVLERYPKINISFEDLRSKGIWAFKELLPLDRNDYEVPLFIGNTPIYEKKEMAKKFGLLNLWIKDDGRNPTASYKDRATAVAISKAKALKKEIIYCASTGNAASSLAGLSAASGMKSVIFVPKTAPEAKITQLLVYGSTVMAVDGSYDEAFDLSMEIGEEFGWYTRNSAINPYLLEGKKTGAMEVPIQIGKVPDVAIVSVGDGTVVSSIYKGFKDMKMAGFTDKIPKIIGVQAEGANAVMRTFESGHFDKPVDMEAHSIADSISVGKPRDVLKACKWVKESGGYFVSVTDEEIGRAIIELARESGVFAEPAGATAYAGLKKIAKDLHEKSVVVFITGNGLKDIKSARNFTGQVNYVKADPSSVKDALRRSGII
ncbi:MAG: threonine synthase [Athalassotoga sp.]|uniref:threonine synthase n=1 Tax=Athalassotoga sp. TaxID=2022597 RepID=UPI003CFF3DE2